MSDVQWYGDDLLKHIREASPDAFFEAGEMLVKAAASKIATGRSGDLANSAYVVSEKKSTYTKLKVSRKAKVPKNGQVIAGFSAFYASMVENGTKHSAAKPYLRPALDELKDKMGGDIAVYIKKKIK